MFDSVGKRPRRRCGGAGRPPWRAVPAPSRPDRRAPRNAEGQCPVRFRLRRALLPSPGHRGSAGSTSTQRNRSTSIHVQAAAPATAARSSGRALVRSASACGGGRTLVESAGACIDWSQMPLVVTHVSGESAFSTAAMSGSFLVPSRLFTGDTLADDPARIES